MSRASSSSAAHHAPPCSAPPQGRLRVLSLESAYRIPGEPGHAHQQTTTSPASVAVEDDLPGDAAMSEAAAGAAANCERRGAARARMKMALSLNGSVHEEGVWSLPSP